MAKINWINFLHFYQPPYQNQEMLKRISKESYDFIFKIIKSNPDIKFTINFNGSLTELLAKNKLQTVIKNYQRLAKKNQIEFVETAKYHPILPLLPEYEIERQIKLNYKINRSYFGSVYSPKGFFCPEMAYSQKIGKIVKKLGYKYIVLDEIALNGKLKSVDPNYKYIDQNTGLEVIFRNRKISKHYPPYIISKLLEKTKEQTVITATDAEIYGFYHKTEHRLKKIIKDKNLETKNISQYLNTLKETKKIKLVNSTWENTEKDIAEKRPYKLWKNSKNPIHVRLWQLADFSIELNKKYDCKKHCVWARKHLDQGLASCSWWWASQKKLSAFAPESWNPDDIEKGALELIKSIRSMDKATLKEKIKAENIYSKLINAIWETHWKKTIKK